MEQSEFRRLVELPNDSGVVSTMLDLIISTANCLRVDHVTKAGAMAKRGQLAGSLHTATGHLLWFLTPITCARVTNWLTNSAKKIYGFTYTHVLWPLLGHTDNKGSV